MSTNTNRKYKDSVFTSLFGYDKNKLLELYNAIKDTNYDRNTEIEITTLENVLYMERINDISFVIDGKIVVLIEHQSTINPNMPLRMLLYIARTYEGITKDRDLYTRNKIAIPHPEFIVLYNGKEEYPDEEVLRLSDMFVQYGVENPINLELTVRVYNINKGRNPEFANKSETLNGYETFIAAIREYEKTIKLEDAIERAIKDCIERNILKDFLTKNSSEVRNMLLTEWNWDTALRVSKEDGIKEGEAKGRQKERQIIFNLLQKQGIDISLIKKQLPREFA